MRVGQITRQILAILEDAGPSGIADIHAYLPDVSLPNISKRCALDVERGLMTVEPGAGNRASFSIFSPALHWRDIAGDRTKKKTVRLKRVGTWSGVSSVFGKG